MGKPTQGFGSKPKNQRILIAGIGGLVRWSKANSTQARSDGTAKARETRRRNLETKADPDGVLPPEERAAAAARLQAAHMRRMALISAQRRARAHMTGDPALLNKKVN